LDLGVIEMEQEGAMTFAQKLNVIRDGGDPKARAAVVREVASGRLERVEHCFECRERMHEIVDRYSRALIETAPRFSIEKDFYDEQYVVSCVARERGDREGAPFSRVSFYLLPCPAEGRFDVHCKRTVRNHEAGGGRCLVALDDARLDGFREFVEEQFCRFAEQYFRSSGAGVSPPSTSDGSLSVR
jgi:hypothetical protein